MDLSRFPRRIYTHAPTPIEHLPHFTKALADGTDTAALINRFTFSIDSTDNNDSTDAVIQSRGNFTINYNVSDQFHELAIPLPNLYNDLPDFLHTLRVACSVSFPVATRPASSSSWRPTRWPRAATRSSPAARRNPTIAASRCRPQSRRG